MDASLSNPPISCAWLVVMYTLYVSFSMTPKSFTGTTPELCASYFLNTAVTKMGRGTNVGSQGGQIHTPFAQGTWTNMAFARCSLTGLEDRTHLRGWCRLRRRTSSCSPFRRARGDVNRPRLLACNLAGVTQTLPIVFLLLSSHSFHIRVNLTSLICLIRFGRHMAWRICELLTQQRGRSLGKRQATGGCAQAAGCAFLCVSPRCG